MKNELSRIRLFIGNLWMIFIVDPFHKIIFSFSCAVFSLFAAEVMRNAFSRVLIGLEGISSCWTKAILMMCAFSGKRSHA